MNMLLPLILGTGILAADAIRVSGQDVPDAEKTIRGVIAAVYGDPTGPEAVGAVPVLIDALTEEDEQIRLGALSALLEIGRPAIPHLIEAIGHDSVIVRSEAARILVSIDRDIDDDPSRVKWSAYAIPEVACSVPYLVSNLKDQHQDVRRSAASALGEIGPPAKSATTALIRALKDDDMGVRSAVARALFKTGGDADVIVSALVNSLDDADVDVLEAVTYALDRLEPGNAAVPHLVNSLASKTSVVRIKAASELGTIGPDAKTAVPDLINTLRDPDEDVVVAAVHALGKIGSDPQSVVPALSAILDGKSGHDRRAVANALAVMARPAQKSMADRSTSELRELVDGFKKAEETIRRTVDASEFESYQLSVAALEAEFRSRFLLRLNKRLAATVEYCKVNWWTWVIVGYFGLSLVWCALLGVWPYRIHKISEFLRQFREPKLKLLVEVTFSFRHLCLVAFFEYRPRVLDAWVKQCLETARLNFTETATVKDRTIHVSLPVRVDDELVTGFGPESVQPAFLQKRVRLLIQGEGGSGKTSLACQLGRSAMDADKTKRIMPHATLPLLIEDELGEEGLIETARGKLQSLVGESSTISTEFFRELLKKKRALIIVDHLSEMSDDTRRQIRLEEADFPASAFVLTSRIAEPLCKPTATLQPILLVGNRVSSFVESYVAQQEKTGVFVDDEEFFDGCRRLTRMVGEREVTVLLAKMYVDQLIRAIEAGYSESVPDSIPELMLRYIRELHPKDTDLDIINLAQRDAIAVAWQCAKDTFYPVAADRVGIVKGLDGDDADSRLKYLEETLRILRREVGLRDQVRFVLDPLAEYLAALHVVDYKSNTRHWRLFLARADEQPLEKITGFLLAVRDCCLASEFNIPDSVPDELAKRGGLDLESLERSRLRERIRRLVHDLKLTNADDRKHAAEVLGSLGPAAGAAVPSLIDALKDSSANVRSAAARALGEIGNEAAVSALLGLLEDDDAYVRSAAAKALGLIGTEAAVPPLIVSLNDGVSHVRVAVIGALGRLGGEAAVSALSKVLNDDHEYYRSPAARALGQTGNEAAVPALIKALRDNDNDVNIRESAALALGQIGSEAAVPALVDALDLDAFFFRDVLLAAVDALGQIGTEAALAALGKAMSHDNEEVSRAVVLTIERISSESQNV